MTTRLKEVRRKRKLFIIRHLIIVYKCLFLSHCSKFIKVSRSHFISPVIINGSRNLYVTRRVFTDLCIEAPKLSLQLLGWRFHCSRFQLVLVILNSSFISIIFYCFLKNHYRFQTFCLNICQLYQRREPRDEISYFVNLRPSLTLS